MNDPDQTTEKCRMDSAAECPCGGTGIVRTRERQYDRYGVLVFDGWIEERCGCKEVTDVD